MSPFEGTSTNRAEFTPKLQNLVPAKNCKPPNLPSQNVRFNGSTMNRDDFKDWTGDLPKQGRLKRIAAPPVRNNAPLGNTTNKEDFHEHNLGQAKVKSAKPDAHVADPRSHAMNNTEYRLNYQPKELALCPTLGLPRKSPSSVTGHVHWLQVKPKVHDPKSYEPATARLP
jgi:hypothetical protein